MLTICMTPPPTQYRIMLLLKPNLVKEVGYARVYSQGGERIRALGDCMLKDASRSLGILNTIPQKKLARFSAHCD